MPEGRDHPARSALVELTLTRLRELTFAAPDFREFPCLALARAAAAEGGTAPAILNAANEVAVEAFCARQISFPGISRMVARTMDRHEVVAQPTLDQIVAADAWARAESRRTGAAPATRRSCTGRPESGRRASCVISSAT